MKKIEVVAIIFRILFIPYTFLMAFAFTKMAGWSGWLGSMSMFWLAMFTIGYLIWVAKPVLGDDETTEKQEPS